MIICFMDTKDRRSVQLASPAALPWIFTLTFLFSCLTFNFSVAADGGKPAEVPVSTKSGSKVDCEEYETHLATKLFLEELAGADKKISLEVIDFSKPAGQEALVKNQVSCSGIYFDGVNKFLIDGKTRLFSNPMGENYQKEDVLKVLKHIFSTPEYIKAPDRVLKMIAYVNLDDGLMAQMPENRPKDPEAAKAAQAQLLSAKILRDFADDNPGRMKLAIIDFTTRGGMGELTKAGLNYPAIFINGSLNHKLAGREKKLIMPMGMLFTREDLVEILMASLSDRSLDNIEIVAYLALNGSMAGEAYDATPSSGGYGRDGSAATPPGARGPGQSAAPGSDGHAQGAHSADCEHSADGVQGANSAHSEHSADGALGHDQAGQKGMANDDPVEAQKRTAAMLREYAGGKPGLIEVEIVDFGTPEGFDRKNRDNVECSKVFVNGDSTFVIGKRKVELAHPMGQNYREPDLIAVLDQAISRATPKEPVKVLAYLNTIGDDFSEKSSASAAFPANRASKTVPLPIHDGLGYPGDGKDQATGGAVTGSPDSTGEDSGPSKRGIPAIIPTVKYADYLEVLRRLERLETRLEEFEAGRK